jgi:acetylornithine deacetylase
VADKSQSADAPVDEVVGRYASHAFEFLERLVRERSVLGAEHGALKVLADELARLGFSIEWLPIPPEIALDPDAGVPGQDYDGRSVLVARRGSWEASNGWRSLLVNGHLDVVPAGNPGRWTVDPFSPQRTQDGRMTGRGSGDMKAGLAMVTLALEALGAARSESVEWPLAVVGVIEEECTGNGTLASIRAGVTADGVLIPEPTGLDVCLSGIGVIWIDVVTVGLAAHAEHANGTNAATALRPIIDGLERLSDDLNANHRPHGSERRETYHMNIGLISAGDWRSTVPGEARMGVRFGFPSDWTPDEAERRIRAVVEEVANHDEWLREHPPVVELSGFRAQGYTLSREDEFAQIMVDAHRRAHGSETAFTGIDSTTDARFYRNQLQIPALCYGPSAHAIHGPDESVELDSIVAGARTLTRAVPRWIEGAGNQARGGKG